MEDVPRAPSDPISAGDHVGTAGQWNTSSRQADHGAWRIQLVELAQEQAESSRRR